MFKFLRELRRREVLRTAALYAGVSWILIEAASSVLLPAFEAPGWVLPGLILAAIMGFPVVVVLAWTYDVTASGVKRERQASGAVAADFHERKLDFLVIGVLVVALIFSVYLNLPDAGERAGDQSPVSVLIADFANDTGESAFDGVVEHALGIGIEGAPHVVSFDRHAAFSIATGLEPDFAGLTPAAARLVATQEGVHVVLSGSLARADGGFRLQVQGLDPATGDTAFSMSAEMPDSEALFAAVDTLADMVRRELGGTAYAGDEDESGRRFSPASLAAAGAYIEGRRLAYDGMLEDAIDRYRTATSFDPRFGRAFFDWAIAELELGRNDTATRLFETAQSWAATMTERERLRRLGIYHATAQRYDDAIEAFSELLEKYPADIAGRRHLAAARFKTLEFENASAEAKLLSEMFPKRRLYRSDLARYSMYAGDFDVAAAEAGALAANETAPPEVYLVLATSFLEAGEPESAREGYRRMMNAAVSQHTQSLAVLGLADVAIYTGELEQAAAILREGIEADIARGDQEAAARKYVAMGEALMAGGDHSMAVEAVGRALELSAADSVRVAAAVVLLQSGDARSATTLAEDLLREPEIHTRAYAMMIHAAASRQVGQYVEAIETLRSAAGLADLWRIRYDLGRTYLEAGLLAEAFDEFENCRQRRGEAAAMFLDDRPTYRYLADLPYWMARAQDGLGMRSAALSNYRRFLALHPQGGPLADDARQRLR